MPVDAKPGLACGSGVRRTWPADWLAILGEGWQEWQDSNLNPRFWSSIKPVLTLFQPVLFRLKIQRSIRSDVTFRARCSALP